MLKYVPPGKRDALFRLKMAPGTKVEDVLRMLRIPDENPKMILINGEVADPGRVLKPDDILSVFPPMAGG